MVQHHEARLSRGESEQLVHVAEFLSNHQPASKRCEFAGPLPAWRRVMAGAILERELTAARSGRVEFDVAKPGDDPEIRRLLRDSSTRGSISISLEREPDYFLEAKNLSARGEGAPADHQAIVARDRDRVVCV